MRQSNPPWIVCFLGSAAIVAASLPAIADGQALERSEDPYQIAYFSNEFLINSRVGSEENHATVAMEDDAHFTVAWSVKPECGACLGRSYLRRFDPDFSPTTGEVPLDSLLGGQNHPDIDTDGHSFYVVTWVCPRRTRPPPYASDLCARKFDVTGEPVGGAFLILVDSLRVQEYPDVAVNSSGDVVIVWAETDVDSLSDYQVQRFDSDMSPVGSRIQVNTVQSGDVSPPDIAIDETGAFVVTWQQSLMSEEGDADIMFRSFAADGSPLTDPVKVDQDSLPTPSRPNVALTGAGKVVVSWRYRGQTGGLGRGVSVRLVDWDGTPMIDEEFLVRAEADQVAPVVMGDKVGFLWTDRDSSESGIYGQVYSARNGGAASKVVQVNQYEAGHQKRPAAAAQVVGDSTYTVITWESWLQDGLTSGIYGRQVILPR